ncbi:MAG: YybH family protein [Sandaracinobacteroides sp.]
MVEGISGPADDVQAIRVLHETYADAVNRNDAAAWGALWADDATWDLMGMQVVGREAIVNLWKGAMAGFGFVGFFSQLGALAVTGNEAQGRVWTHEVLDGPEGERRPLGRYDDIYAKHGGRWLFQRRQFSLRRP